MPVKNYRDNRIVINGEAIMIGGFARPGDNIDQVAMFQQLNTEHQVDAVISLSGNYSGVYAAAGLDPEFYTYGEKVDVYDWYDTPSDQSQPINPSVYDNVYQAVTKAQAAGKKIAIHCGAGDGRTGTALASLKLRELLEREFEQDPERFINTTPEENETVHTHYGASSTSGRPRGESTVKATPLVKEAIERIRENDNPSHHSVESPNDVQTLLNYERHLRLQMVLRHQNQPNSDQQIKDSSGLQSHIEDSSSRASGNQSIITQSINDFIQTAQELLRLLEHEAADVKNKNPIPSAGDKVWLEKREQEIFYTKDTLEGIKRLHEQFKKTQITGDKFIECCDKIYNEYKYNIQKPSSLFRRIIYALQKLIDEFKDLLSEKKEVANTSNFSDKTKELKDRARILKKTNGDEPQVDMKPSA